MRMLSERDVADILGDLCDGFDVPQIERDSALEALSGLVQTADRGERLYYVEVDTLLLENTDTAEAIWSVASDGVARSLNGDKIVDLTDVTAAVQCQCFTLWLLCDAANFARIKDLWLADVEAQSTWETLMARIVTPLRKWLDCLA